MPKTSQEGKTVNLKNQNIVMNTILAVWERGFVGLGSELDRILPWGVLYPIPK